MLSSMLSSMYAGWSQVPIPKEFTRFSPDMSASKGQLGSDSGSDYSACSVTTSASHSTLEKTNHIISLCKVFPSFFNISSYHSFLDLKSANFQPLPYICTTSFLLSQNYIRLMKILHIGTKPPRSQRAGTTPCSNFCSFPTITHENFQLLHDAYMIIKGSI